MLCYIILYILYILHYITLYYLYYIIFVLHCVTYRYVSNVTAQNLRFLILQNRYIEEPYAKYLHMIAALRLWRLSLVYEGKFPYRALYQISLGLTYSALM